jgi:glycosyltransferase involved in cell wall biosynthesis
MNVRCPLQWIPFRHDYCKSYFAKFLLKVLYEIGELTKAIKRYQIDIVHTNSIVCLGGALAAKFTGKVHIWEVVEILANNNHYVIPFGLRTIGKLATFFSYKVITPSEFAKRSFLGGSWSNNVVTIYNGVDVARFEHPGVSKETLREIFNIDEKIALAGIIGRVTLEKGLIDVVNAAVILKERSPRLECKFVVVGPSTSSFMEIIRTRIKKVGLESMFIFTGFRSDIPEILHEIDFLISASWTESFGRTLIEAMAAGKPVVTTNSGGPSEIVESGVTGYIVPPMDPVALANAIALVLSDPDLGEKLGIAGRMRAKRLFSAEGYVKNFENVYQEINVRRSSTLADRKKVDVESKEPIVLSSIMHQNRNLP